MISWPYQSQAQRTNFFGDRLAWGVDATERNGLTLRALAHPSCTLGSSNLMFLQSGALNLLEDSHWPPVHGLDGE